MREDAPLAPTSPYGSTKLMSENILRDVEVRRPVLADRPAALLQPGRRASERHDRRRPARHAEQPDALRRPGGGGQAPSACTVFGNDYETPDGSGVRDYLHVQDLAEGHVAALRHLLDGGESLTLNLGTGRGVSVLELVRAFEAASGRPVPYEIAPRRAGDVAACYADPTLAEQRLGWKAELDLDAMCADSWRWQSANPEGYAAG